jgi:pimeloyl-ACP methyl ester carboxylesterase
MSSTCSQPGPFDCISRAIAWVSMRIPRVAPAAWWQDYNKMRGNDLVAQAFEVVADDGVKLAALHLPAARQTRLMQQPEHAHDPGLPPPSPSPLPVVFAHGWTETKEVYFRFARLLLARGHDVILFDQRGHGDSGGQFSSIGSLETRDLRRVIDEAARQGFIGQRVITMGISMGGAAVLCEAADDPRVAGVVSFAPYTSYVNAVRCYQRRMFPFVGGDWAVRGFEQMAARSGFDPHAAAPISVIRRIACPILIIVGQQDVNLPAAEHSRVLAAACDHGRCLLVEVPHANHFDVARDPWPIKDAAVVRFCAQVDRLAPA